MPKAKRIRSWRACCALRGLGWSIQFLNPLNRVDLLICDGRDVCAPIRLSGS
jgi:hypothetical protein